MLKYSDSDSARRLIRSVSNINVEFQLIFSRLIIEVYPIHKGK